MEEVAQALARVLVPQLPAASTVAMHAEPATVRRVGDLVDMLRLPAGQRLFAAQEVDISRVVVQTDMPWAPRGDSDVLLLGDSFTNIYSDAAMGWGESAGFAEHLSLALGRPLDVLAENGGGAAALRLSLARAENRKRLAGKRLVIYQFAVRDLVGQHWPVVRVPVDASAAPAVPADASEIEIEGTIVQTSQVPDPATAPYSSSVGMMRIAVDRVVRGDFAGRELVAGFPVMRNRVLLPAARYVRGDRFRLRLVPFNRAGRAIRSLQRSDDLGAIDLPAFWTVGEQRQ